MWMNVEEIDWMEMDCLEKWSYVSLEMERRGTRREREGSKEEM